MTRVLFWWLCRASLWLYLDMSSVKDISKDKLLCHAVPQSLGLSDHGNSCQTNLVMVNFWHWQSGLYWLFVLLLYWIVLLLHCIATTFVLLHCDHCDFVIFFVLCCYGCALWIVTFVDCIVSFHLSSILFSQKTKREWSSSNKNKANKQTCKQARNKQGDKKRVNLLQVCILCELWERMWVQWKWWFSFLVLESCS